MNLITVLGYAAQADDLCEHCQTDPRWVAGPFGLCGTCQNGLESGPYGAQANHCPTGCGLCCEPHSITCGCGQTGDACAPCIAGPCLYCGHRHPNQSPCGRATPVMRHVPGKRDVPVASFVCACTDYDG